jgi:NADH dehydrogenase
MEKRYVFLTGGTGFVGQHVARRLAERGHGLRALVRSAAGASALRELGAELVEGDVTGDIDGEMLAECDAVIHLVGIIREKPPAVTFERVHTRGTLKVVEAAKSAAVKKFVQMSALGAAAQGAAYQRTKYEAEELVRRSGLPYVIFRPSVIVGSGGEFTDLLIRMVHRAPAVPVIGDGNYRLQPVDVENVASAFVLAVEREDLSAKSYDIGGPHKLTYNRVLEIVGEELGVRRKLFHVPASLVRPLVDLATNWRLPVPVTSDQLEMLFQESIVPGESNVLRDVFGIEPSTFRSVLQRASQG